MTRYTHPDFDGTFPRPRGQFVTIGEQQIGSSFFATSSSEEIAALGFIQYTPPAPEPIDETPVIPYAVTRRQVLTALGILGWITEEEAEAALTTGARPVAVDVIIDNMPAEHRFSARMKWAGFQTAYRDDPMVLGLAAIENKTEEDIDNLFILASQVE